MGHGEEPGRIDRRDPGGFVVGPGTGTAKDVRYRAGGRASTWPRRLRELPGPMA